MVNRRPLSVLVVAFTLLTTAACGDDSADDPVAAGSEVSGSRSDDSSTTSTDQQPTADGEATGFYVPGELPEGWSVRFDSITNPWQELCPCETTMWSGSADETIRTFTSQQQEEPDQPYEFEGETSRHRAIPGGYLSIDGQQVTVAWFDGEITRRVFTEGLEADEVEEMARGWTGDEPLDVPDEFELIWSGRTPEIVRRTEMYWRISDDTTDRSMVLHVEPWMYDEVIEPSSFYPEADPVVLEGNGFTLVQTPGWEDTHFAGLWPGGAYLSVASSYGEINHSADPLTREEMLEVAGGFRPVTSQGWSDYIEGLYDPEAIEACRPLLLKPLLADLLVQPDDPGADLDVDLHELNDDCVAPWPDEAAETVDGSDGPSADIPTVDTSTIGPPTTEPNG